MPDKRKIRVGSLLWKELKKNTSTNIKDFRRELQKIRSTTGVSCFSEKCDSLLMWAHYAHNHKGMCVEYDLSKFNSILGFTPAPVIYDNEKIRLQTIDPNNIFVFLTNSLLHKSLEWSYENEWRIIRDSGSCGELWNYEKKGALLSSIRPSSIILGCDAEEQFSYKVKKLCNDNKIDLYKMEKDDIEYILNKKEVLIFK